MSASDFTYDPTGVSAANLILEETHSITATKAVMPRHDSFYRNSFIVLGTVDGLVYTSLTENVNFFYSPMHVKVAANTGREVYSYIVIRGNWTSVKIKYQVVGGKDGRDSDLLTIISNTEFDRMDPTAWMRFTGSESFNPRTRTPELIPVSEIELLNRGIEKIKIHIESLTPGKGNNATLQMVQALELKQISLTQGFLDIREQFEQLDSYSRYGELGNTLQDGGYIYSEDAPTTIRTVEHGIGSELVDITVWQLGLDLVYRQTDNVIAQVLSTDGIRIVTPEPEQLMVIVRPVTVETGGYLYTSETLTDVHVINHELNSGFLSVSLWVQDNATGFWVWSPNVVTAANNNQMVVALPSPAVLRVVVQQPVNNAFIFRSDAAGAVHRLEHNLRTTYVGLTVWEAQPDGTFTTSVQDSSIVSSSIIDVRLDTSKAIKAIVQPALAEPATITQQQQQITTTLAETVNNIVDTGILNTHLYDSTGVTGPKLIHIVQHNLDDNFVEPIVWVQGEDGFFYRDSVRIRNLSPDSFEVSLSRLSNIRSKTTKA